MASDDERDRYKPKTPPVGVRAQTARDHRDPEFSRSEDDTPVGMLALPAMNARTKAISATTDDIRGRVGQLESGLSDARVRITELAAGVANLDGKLDVLVEESKHSRHEREEREKRAENRAAAELAFRRDRSIKIIAIVVPTLTALGGLIAAVIAAYNSSGH